MLAWGELAKRGMKRSSNGMGRYGREACFPISPLPRGERVRERGRVYRTVFARSRAVLPSDGTPNQATKPASGQVAGYPQPSVAAARFRCSPPPQPSPLEGEGVWRAVVGAPPLCPLGCSGGFAVRSGGVARFGVGSPSDGTPNQSTKPASGQVAGYPQPSPARGRGGERSASRVRIA